MPGDPRREADSSLYTIDVTGGALNEQLRQQIARSARPLRDIDLRSDASVEFLGLDPGPSTPAVAFDPDLDSEGDDWDDGMPSSPPDITPTPAPRTGYQRVQQLLANARETAQNDRRLVNPRSGL